MTNTSPGLDEAQAAEVEQIRKQIADFIDSELQSRELLYLSAVGAAMREPLGRFKQLTGQTLGQIVENDLADSYQVARLGAHKNVLALCRIGQDPLKLQATRPDRAPVLRYNRNLWLAFAVPLTANYRHIDMNALKFQDSDDATPPEGHLAIDREYLRGDDDPHEPSEIVRRIGTWLAKNSFDPSRYLEKPSSLNQQRVQGRSVLEDMISVLDRRQLQSVSLPLDVVDSLLRHRP